MKNKILFILGLVLLGLSMGSCRGDSDTLMSYDHKDNLAFKEAEKSFAGKFKVIWNALNQNYALWDYEQQNGLDWDAVYDEYLPQFEALDEREKVTDAELEDLLKKVLNPLHDGHMVIFVKNHLTGRSIRVAPAMNRNMQRPDFDIADICHPTLEYYAKIENGEVEVTSDGEPIYMEYSTHVDDLLNQFMATDGYGLRWMADSIASLQQLTTPTAKQVEILQTLTNLYNLLNYGVTGEDDLKLYNTMCERFSYLNIPGFDPIDPKFGDYGVDIKFALLKGNIAYLYFSDFHLTFYLVDAVRDEGFPNADEYTNTHMDRAYAVWSAWINAIQKLHSLGQLGGVIIDVRGNGGGLVSDFQFALGALLPRGGFTYGDVRFKRGTGRLDYSPLMPQVIGTLELDHAIITEPIVVLANCRSISMAEITSLSAKEVENARLIGKRTWGGLCTLTDNEEFSYNYSGHIGVKDQTPVFIYLPTLATFTRDGKQLEGIGITPDIDVDLDEDLFTLTGKDTQLDRALQYIRTGN